MTFHEVELLSSVFVLLLLSIADCRFGVEFHCSILESLLEVELLGGSAEGLNLVTSRRSAAAMRGLTEDGGEFHEQFEFQEFLFVVDECDDPRYWRRC